MKTLSELLNQSPVFLNNWDDVKDVISDFEGVWEEKELEKALEKYKGIKILFASYGYSNYEGDAWVLYTEDNQLFEINAGHCSCYGLEEQWDKEPVVLKELKHRLEKGTFGTDNYAGNLFAKELKEFLGIK